MSKVIRKFLTFIASLLMVVSFLPVMAEGGDSEEATLNNQLNNGGIVVLQKDYTEDIVVENGTTVTIDLNNHKITNTSGHTITNKGNLTITGSGTVDSTINGKGAIYNEVGATLTIKGGTYTRSQEVGVNNESKGNSWYTIKNYGTMTIDGGTISNTGSYSSTIANGWYDASNPSKSDNSQATTTTAKLTINGGTISGGKITIKNDDNAELTINGGTFTNEAGNRVVQTVNVATINGGTFSLGTSVWTNNIAVDNWKASSSDFNKGELTINGGTFNGRVINRENGSIKISAGTFTNDPSEFVVSPATTYNNNGTYIVHTCKNDVTAHPAVEPTTEKEGNLAYWTCNVCGKLYTSAECTTETTLEKVTIAKVVEKEPEGTATTGTTEAQKQATAKASSEVAEAATSGSVTVKDSSGKTIEASSIAKVETTVTANTKSEEEVKSDAEKVDTTLSKEETIGGYVDITLAATVTTTDGNTINGTIDETNGTKIPVTFSVASMNTVKLGSQFVKVAHVHDGVVEYLPTTIDETNKTITVEMDKFSTLAVVTADTTTVTFLSEGKAYSTQEVKYAAKASKPKDPTRKDYKFEGWYSDEALTQAYNFDTQIKTQDVKVYAKWVQASKTPNTADDSNVLSWAMMTIVSLLACIGSVLYRKSINY